MHKPNAILFDWDNTLVDTWPVIHLALSETMLAMGQEPWSLETVKTQVHRSMRDSFPDLFGPDWEKAGKIYQQSYRHHRTEKLLPLPLAEAVLQKLQRDPSIYVAVVSNKIGTTLREEIAHLGWESYFQKMIGAHDAAEDKPSPAPIHLALEGSNIPVNNDVWLVGDSITDLECAHNSGITPIFYGESDPLDIRYQHCRPHSHCANHQVLIALLEQL